MNNGNNNKEPLNAPGNWNNQQNQGPYGQQPMNQGYPPQNQGPYGQQTQTNVVVVSMNEPNVCGNRIPSVDGAVAIIILIINIFFPGIGTMIIGCVGGNTNCLAWFCIGLLQIFLVPIFLIGWIWSIITGCKVMSQSGRGQVIVQTTTKY